MNDWMPRFVGPRGMVIWPESVMVCSPYYGYIQYTASESLTITEPIRRLRPDRPTGLTDQNGKIIFERDRVADEWGIVWTVCMDDGAWCVCDENDGQCEILDTIGASIVTTTDMVPYKEDADE